MKDRARLISRIIGAVGVLLILFAVYGRFHGAPTIRILGHDHAASVFLLIGNAVLLIGLYAGLYSLQARE